MRFKFENARRHHGPHHPHGPGCGHGPHGGHHDGHHGEHRGRPHGGSHRDEWQGRARRGAVRLGLLSLLGEEAATGYALMKAAEEKSAGGWRMSPGSVYPTLDQLVDEGLVQATEDEQGKRKFTLTPDGRTYIGERTEQIAAIWERGQALQGGEELRAAVGELRQVLKQIAREGSDNDRSTARNRIQALVEELRQLL